MRHSIAATSFNPVLVPPFTPKAESSSTARAKAKPTGSASTTISHSASGSTATAITRVLIVEDEGLIAHDIAQRVEGLGYKVVATVSTAEEALEQAPNSDIVLMDIRIDGPRDGIQAAQEIRDRFHVPVVFLTAHADRMTLERAKTAGPFGYLVKPLGPVALQTSIEMAVHKHSVDRKVEERAEWLDVSVAAAADAILLTDVDSRVRLMNPAAEALTGWTNEEAHGRSIEEIARLVEHDSQSDYGDPVPLAMLRDAPVSLDQGLRLVTRDGRELEIEGTAAPVHSRHHSGRSELAGAVIALRDVTARRWEERQLMQAQRLEAAARLAGRISTDYTTMIEAMRQQTDNLAKQLGEYAPARQALEEMQRSASAAAQTTRRLAAFGSRQIMHPEPVSVSAMLRRMSKLIESVAGAQVPIQLKIEPGAGRVRADSSQLEQAILNVVMHACAAMPNGGKLRVESGRAEAPRQGHISVFTMVRISYTAAETDLQRLLDPAGVEESGLALPVAHSIVTEHDGYLAVRPLEDGTCIEILLPSLSDELAEPVDMMQLACEAPVVLLVDYRDRVRAQLHNFFESAGYNLMEASNREEAVALAAVHEGSIDLLIAEEGDAEAILEGLASEAALGLGLLDDEEFEVGFIEAGEDGGELANLLECTSLTQSLFDPGSRIKQLQTLFVVDGPECSPNQIRRPFTQHQLLQRVEAMLPELSPLEGSRAAGSESADGDLPQRASGS